MRLWQRLSLAFVSVLVITGLVLGWSVDREVSTDMRADQQRWSQILTRAIGKSVINDLIENNRRGVQETLVRVVKDAGDIDYVVVIGFDGGAFASTYDGLMPEYLKTVDHSQCIQSSRIFDVMRSEGAASGSHETEHVVVDYSYPLINNLAAHIHLGVRQDAINQTIAGARAKVINSVVLVSFVGLLVALLVSRTVSQPVVRLSERLRLFRTQGKLQKNSARSGVPEIRELESDFEQLIEERYAYENEILEYRDRLEEKVKERTRDLDEEINRHKKTAEVMRQAKEEAEKANKAKSAFLSSMSHELRTPLNAILGFSQLIEMEFMDKDPEMLENIREVLHAGQLLLSLINEVLDLARIESGRLQISIEIVDLPTVLRDCVQLMSKTAEQKQVTIHMLSINEKAGAVKADNLRMKQIVLNLLSNAVKYNREGGDVFVSLTLTDDSYCRLEVRDTGKGIAEHYHHKIFKPFERLHSQYSAIEGTGIGLVITRALVEKMDGRIGFDSKEGDGSTFWVELPLIETDIRQEEKLPGDMTSPMVKAGEKVILYVEDNISNISMVRKIFNSQDNVQLLVAEQPSEAFKILEGVVPDLILLDINLPEMNGFEVIQKIRFQQNLAAVPVIAVSANAMEHDIETAREHGFIDYITKPFDVRDFIERLNKYLP